MKRILTMLCLGIVLGLANAHAEENASNPLAKVKNTDARWRYFDVGSSNYLHDIYVDGAFMANDKLKIKYEAHIWSTNLSGRNETGLESTTLKAIYFPREKLVGDVGMRLALGMDWVKDFGDTSQGIGTGSDQVAPFVGVAMAFPSGDSLIPLLQHNVSYNGEDINVTTVRAIWIRPLLEGRWLKLDTKIPFDWENDNAIPASMELQYGKNISSLLGIYVDGMIGLGKDRQFDWGAGLGLRFKY